MFIPGYVHPGSIKYIVGFLVRNITEITELLTLSSAGGCGLRHLFYCLHFIGVDSFSPLLHRILPSRRIILFQEGVLHPENIRNGFPGHRIVEGFRLRCGGIEEPALRFLGGILGGILGGGGGTLLVGDGTRLIGGGTLLIGQPGLFHELLNRKDHPDEKFFRRDFRFPLDRRARVMYIFPESFRKENVK